MQNATRTSGFLIVLAAILWIAAPAAQAEEISFESLLREMVDRDRLARFPAPYYTCLQFSSYDRDSTERDKEGWFANWDRSQFIRADRKGERTEHVLMDADGPGAVVRFWGTWHGPKGRPFTNGTLRVYLDNGDAPVIEGPIVEIISGGALTGEPLSASCSPLTEFKRRAHNLYLPIPYAKHCTITYESEAITDAGAREGEALYYQINYRTYDRSAEVKTFSHEDLKRAGPLLARVQRDLARSPGAAGELDDRIGAQRLAPGGSLEFELEGPAAIRELALNLGAADREQTLRSTVVEISFDGKRTVWCPVGDFFGTGHRLSPYKTWYTEVTRDGTMACYWVMPFAESARIAFRNLGDQPVDVNLGLVRSGEWTWDDRSLYFHAAWRQYAHRRTRAHKGMSGEHAEDLNYIEIRGAGRFVGDALAVFNGAKAWWGEGDEKIYVDSEAFPSHIGTGTEDYYSYAWCRPEFFETPFHAQPEGGGNLEGGFSVNCRFRSLDAIPFKRSLRFDMELWHWAATRINFAPVTIWYAMPGASWNAEPAIDEARRAVPRSRDDVNLVVGVEGAVEGETMKIADHEGGTTEIQEEEKYGWSRNRQLWWKDAKPGDTLVVELDAPRTGTYRITGAFTFAKDYGIVRVAVNGRSLTKDLDFYNHEVETRDVDLGVFELKKSRNRLRITIAGANEAAEKRHMFGLDYLLLSKE